MSASSTVPVRPIGAPGAAGVFLLGSVAPPPPLVPPAVGVWSPPRELPPPGSVLVKSVSPLTGACGRSLQPATKDRAKSQVRRFIADPPGSPSAIGVLSLTQV